MLQPKLPPRLLLFNLMTDADDPVLGFTTAWIHELARHCESIDVITMYRGRVDVPDNVRVFSAGREKGVPKALRVLHFYRHLLYLLTTRNYDACFAHMMPLFAGLGGPILTAHGVPMTLWYTHRQKSTQLALGMKMSKNVVTAVPTSFPYVTDKLRVIGHGVDTDFYAPLPEGYHPKLREGRPIVLQVARLASIKYQDVVIRAIADLDVHLVLVGGIQPGSPPAYRQSLESLVDELNLRDRVTFAGDLQANEVRDWYRQASIAVNMSPVGLFDKSALESMACGVPTVVCNPEFDNLHGDYRALLSAENPTDEAGLRTCIDSLLKMSIDGRARIGQTQRDGVIAHHSLAELIQRLLSVLQTGDVPLT